MRVAGLEPPTTYAVVAAAGSDRAGRVRSHPRVPRRSSPPETRRALQCAKLRHSERSILLALFAFAARTVELLAAFFYDRARVGDAGALLRQRTAASLGEYMAVTAEPLLKAEAEAAVAEESAARGLG